MPPAMPYRIMVKCYKIFLKVENMILRKGCCEGQDYFIFLKRKDRYNESKPDLVCLCFFHQNFTSKFTVYQK